MRQRSIQKVVKMNIVKQLKGKASFKKSLKIIVLSLLLFLFIGEIITLFYGVENLDILRVFSDDESLVTKTVLNNLVYNDLDPRGHYVYGYFYQTIGFFVCKVLISFGFKANAMLAALVLRILSFIFYWGAGILTYKIFRDSLGGDESFGLISVLFLLGVPDFAYWACMVHPDMLQVFLVLLAAFVAFSRHKASNLCLAAAVTGVAFGTKYVGGFILPFLFVPYFLNSLHSSTVKKKSWIKVICVGILTIFIALLVWAVTNPYAIKNFTELKKDYLFAKDQLGRGHGRAESTNSLLWFKILWQQLGTFNSAVIIAGTAVVIIGLTYAFRKSGIKTFIGNPTHRNLVTVILYILVAFAYLMWAINSRRPRYIFHILPFILMIAIYGCQKMTGLFKNYWVKPVIIIILLFSISLMAFNVMSEVSKFTLKYDSEYITAGNLLTSNVPPHSTILADIYSYVPPNFKYKQLTWELNKERVINFQPDILILNIKVTGRKSWKKKGTTFKDMQLVAGKDDHWEPYYNFQKKLFSPGSEWKIIYETDNIVILKKKVAL